MKSFFLTLTAFLFMLPLWAQKATEKDLQGNWRLITYAVQGASLDVQSGQVTLDKPDSTLMAAMTVNLKADMEAYAEGLRQSSLEIVGNNFNQVIVDFVRNGPFTLGEKNGHQVITAHFDNGTSDDVPFEIVNGKLHLSNSQGNKRYIYEKIK
jgi:hypothetical protein